jgi:glutamine amidotransferase-like uncharacterized protein
MAVKRNHCVRYVCYRLLIVLSGGCLQSPPDTQLYGEESAFLREATIALYADRGTWEGSLTACEAMFTWMGYSVVLVDAEDIRNRVLDTAAVLCILGGNMYQYAQDLTAEGIQSIREFIQDGGGYVGICGGAYLAAEHITWRGLSLPQSPLALFSGAAQSPLPEIAGYPHHTMCFLICEESLVPADTEAVWMLYYGGPGFIVDDETTVTVLGRYEEGNMPAILRFPMGEGKCFLIGTPPEIEEDCVRDGSSFGDESRIKEQTGSS